MVVLFMKRRKSNKSNKSSESKRPNKRVRDDKTMNNRSPNDPSSSESTATDIFDPSMKFSSHPFSSHDERAVFSWRPNSADIDFAQYYATVLTRPDLLKRRIRAIMTMLPLKKLGDVAKAIGLRHSMFSSFLSSKTKAQGGLTSQIRLAMWMREADIRCSSRLRVIVSERALDVAHIAAEAAVPPSVVRMYLRETPLCAVSELVSITDRCDVESAIFQLGHKELSTSATSDTLSTSDISATSGKSATSSKSGKSALRNQDEAHHPQRNGAQVMSYGERDYEYIRIDKRGKLLVLLPPLVKSTHSVSSPIAELFYPLLRKEIVRMSWQAPISLPSLPSSSSSAEPPLSRSPVNRSIALQVWEFAWAPQAVVLDDLPPSMLASQEHLSAPFRVTTVRGGTEGDKCTEEKEIIVLKALCCSRGDKCCIINAAGAVRVMRWCPVGDSTHPGIGCEQFLAVASNVIERYPPRHVCPGDAESIIQLWSFGVPCAKDGTFDRSAYPKLVMAMVVRVGSGAVVDLKWCPESAWQPPPSSSSKGDVRSSRLGILAVIGGDGIPRLFSVPHPSNFELSGARTRISTRSRQSDHETKSAREDLAPVTDACVFVRLAPISRCGVRDQQDFSCISWSPNADNGVFGLACGSLQGTVGVWFVDPANASRECPVAIVLEARPALGIMGVDWHPKHRYMLLACMSSGRVLGWDLRHPYAPFLNAAIVSTGSWFSMACLYTDELAVMLTGNLKNRSLCMLNGQNGRFSRLFSHKIMYCVRDDTPLCQATFMMPHVPRGRSGRFFSAVGYVSGALILSGCMLDRVFGGRARKGKNVIPTFASRILHVLRPLECQPLRTYATKLINDVALYMNFPIVFSSSIVHSAESDRNQDVLKSIFARQGLLELPVPVSEFKLNSQTSTSCAEWNSNLRTSSSCVQWIASGSPCGIVVVQCVRIQDQG